MAFDAKYETGVLWQDFQHKQLIDLFGKIKEAGSDDKDKNLYRYTIAFLAMYVNHHFKLEEEYMGKYNYPDKELHEKKHREFVKELKEFRAENKNYSRAGTDDLMMRMGEWILSHILENDQKLGKFILQKEHLLDNSVHGYNFN
ncbi:MAG: hemerythrin family protein [Deltaproteobacteria bacterium]|nr:hemerythrin family protein [Deltaproteobacteria bacterium]